MRTILVLVALMGLAAYPAMAAAPVEKGSKESATEQKPSQEKPAASRPPAGSMVSIPAGEFTMGSPEGAVGTGETTSSFPLSALEKALDDQDAGQQGAEQPEGDSMLNFCGQEKHVRRWTGIP